MKFILTIFSQVTIFYQVLESEIYLPLEQSEKTGQLELPNLWRLTKPCPRNLAVVTTTVVMARWLCANGMTTLRSIFRVITLLMSRFMKQVEE